MKLAEALIQRADLQKRIQQLRQRLAVSVRIQEGDTPPEDPQELLAEVGRLAASLTDLIRRINHTNLATALGEGLSLTDALAERDTLSLQHRVLTEAITAATATQQRYGFGHGDVRYVRTVDIPALQQQADDLARRRRELDTRIQAMNWQADLIEA